MRSITAGSTVPRCFIGSKVKELGPNLYVTEPRLSRTRSIYSGIMSLLLTTLVIKEAVAWLLAKWGSCGFEGQSGYVLKKNGPTNLR